MQSRIQKGSSCTSTRVFLLFSFLLTNTLNLPLDPRRINSVITSTNPSKNHPPPFPPTMPFLCCEHTKRVSRFFKKSKPVHGQKVLPGADTPWPNEKAQPLSNNNALADGSEMTSSTSPSTQTSASVVAPPPYKEKSESLKSFDVVGSALHEQ